MKYEEMFMKIRQAHTTLMIMSVSNAKPPIRTKRFTCPGITSLGIECMFRVRGSLDFTHHPCNTHNLAYKLPYTSLLALYSTKKVHSYT